jgi:RimJ/RimL family protein N-acetyltransferase
MWAMEDVVRYIGEGIPRSRAESWQKFLAFPGHWRMAGFGSWAIEEKTSGELIGEVGFIARNLPAGDPLAGIPELGYGVVPSASGKGYVTEAVKRVLEWGREEFGPVRVLAVITPGNDASIRVARNCGFAPAGEITAAGAQRLLFDRTL